MSKSSGATSVKAKTVFAAMQNPYKLVRKAAGEYVTANGKYRVYRKHYRYLYGGGKTRWVWERADSQLGPWQSAGFQRLFNAYASLCYYLIANGEITEDLSLSEKP